MIFLLIVLSALREGEGALRILGHAKEAGEGNSWVVRLVEHHDCGSEGTSHGVICSGSILNRQWVLSGAHCAGSTHVQLKAQSTNRRAKNGRRGGKIVYRKIQNVHLHPAYLYQDTWSHTRGRLENDIALYETEGIKLKEYPKLDSRDYNALYGREVNFLGFGMTKYQSEYENQTEIDNELTNGPLMYGMGLLGDCASLKYRGDLMQLSFLFNFCVMRKCTEYALLSNNGDTGGPVVVQGRIAGINSVMAEQRVAPPSDDQVAVVATPISPYIDWIQEIATRQSVEFD